MKIDPATGRVTLAERNRLDIALDKINKERRAEKLSARQMERLRALAVGPITGRGASPTLLSLQKRGLARLTWISTREWSYSLTPKGRTVVLNTTR